MTLRSALAATAAVLVVAGCGSTGVPEAGDAGVGEELFKQKCGSCHTLAAAGTQGNVGPNLDAAFARSKKDGFDETTISGVVRNMIEYPVAPMPQREELGLTNEQADDIATFVAQTAAVEGAAAPPPAPSGGDAAAADGKAIFASAGCTSCHTLADAGATGTIGPNLDETKPSVELAVDRVTNGSGAMPPFKGQLSDAEIKAVAEYVASVAGK